MAAPRASRKPPSRWVRFNRWARSAEGQKWTHRAPALVIALAAFYISYEHIRQAALDHGYDKLGASILPLAVDGLVMVAARYISHAQVWYGKLTAFVGMAAATVATIAGNLLTAEPAFWDRAAAATPAVLLILAGLTIHLGDKKPKRKPSTRSAPAPRRRRNAVTTMEQIEALRVSNRRKAAKARPAAEPKPAGVRATALQADTAEQPTVKAEDREPEFAAI